MVEENYGSNPTDGNYLRIKTEMYCSRAYGKESAGDDIVYEGGCAGGPKYSVHTVSMYIKG